MANQEHKAILFVTIGWRIVLVGRELSCVSELEGWKGVCTLRKGPIKGI